MNRERERDGTTHLLILKNEGCEGRFSFKKIHFRFWIYINVDRCYWPYGWL